HCYRNGQWRKDEVKTRTARSRSRTTRSRAVDEEEAELWMKTYGICGSPRVPIL
ncbi:hypothetical protein T4D_1253, partial [Trichinella pseudospiralis]